VAKDKKPGPPVHLATAIYLGIVGSSVLLVLPIFVGSLVSSLELSNSEAGWIGSADLIGYTIGALVAFRIIDTAQWKRLTLAGLGLMAVGNAISIGLSSVPLLIATRVICSGLGAGLVIAIPYRALGLMSNPERKTGIYWTFNVLGGALALLILPRVVEAWGSSGLFVALLAVVMSAFPLAVVGVRSPVKKSLMRGGDPRLDSSAADDIISTDGSVNIYSTTGITKAAFLLLAAVAMFNLGLGSVWAFIDRPAAALGLNLETTGSILSGTYLVSMLGSSVAAWQGSRIGFLRPYAGSMLAMTGALVLLIAPPSVFVYIAALSLINFCWNYGMTYQFSAIYASDSSGRTAVLIILAQSVGLMLGPGIAGMLVEYYSYAAGPVFGILLCSFSAASFAAGTLIGRGAESPRSSKT